MEPREEFPRYLPVKIICPGCGRVIKAMDIKTDETFEGDFKCKKCPFKDFKWSFIYPTPDPKRNWYPRYAHIEIHKLFPLYKIPKMKKFGDKTISHSNK